MEPSRPAEPTQPPPVLAEVQPAAGSTTTGVAAIESPKVDTIPAPAVQPPAPVPPPPATLPPPPPKVDPEVPPTTFASQVETETPAVITAKPVVPVETPKVASDAPAVPSLAPPEPPTEPTIPPPPATVAQVTATPPPPPGPEVVVPPTTSVTLPETPSLPPTTTAPSTVSESAPATSATEAPPQVNLETSNAPAPIPTEANVVPAAPTVVQPTPDVQMTNQTTLAPAPATDAAMVVAEKAEVNGTPMSLKRPKPDAPASKDKKKDGSSKAPGPKAAKKPKVEKPLKARAISANQAIQPNIAHQGSSGAQAPTMSHQQHEEQQFMQHQQMGQQTFQNGQLQQQQMMGNNFGQSQQHIPQGGTPVLVQTPVPPGAEQQRQLKVEDAMNYLDEVKSQFGNQPQVYNHFLEIMKSFKSQAIDTPGVIDSVSELFRGHNNLILGFNTFLPPGFKIEINNDPRAQPTLQATQPHTQAVLQQHLQQQQEQQQQQAMHQHNAFMQGNMPPPDYVNMGVSMAGNGQNFQQQGQNSASMQMNRGGGHLLNMMQPNMGQQMGQSGAPEGVHMQNNGGSPGMGPMGPMAGMPLSHNFVPMGQPGGVPMMSGGNTEESKQPLEFDHAINYVTKIKKRFQDDAETYKQFLDILHTYQKEQKSIKEVLDQVADLFKDHTDLLKEFLFFLPDSVREHAKEEIARLSKSRRKRQKRINDKNAAKAKAKEQEKEQPLEDPLNRIPRMERKVFIRIKNALGSRERWGEFLKCLDLFAQAVISRSELITLLSDVFENRDDLLNEFDRLLAMRGATDNIQEDAWFSMPLQEVDFAQCRRCTPSYRALPATYPKPPCSERTALCRSVLNDTWVSMPTGSEDFSFMRRNQYEEVLYKVADEMYEVDLVIESNAAAIRRLTPLAREIEALKCKTGDPNSGARWRYKLDRRTLSAIHLKAIARVYGEHGSEILELLRKNPAGAIPVILQRLKQKDVEWRRNQFELNKSWKEQQEKNYYKSLDYQLDFKSNDKRRILPRQLMADIKERAKAKATGVIIRDPSILMTTNAQVVNSTVPLTAPEEITYTNEKLLGDINEPDLVLEFTDVNIHRHCWALIAYATEVQMSKADAERASAMFKQFIHPLFDLPKSWLNANNSISAFDICKLPLNKQEVAADSNETLDPKDAFPPNTRVLTEYGVGSVVSFDESTNQYKVHLRFGDAYIQPNRMTLGTSSDEGTSLPISTLDEGDSTENQKGPVYFASHACLYFIRLYHLIYTRLKKLKDLCDSGDLRSAKHSVRHYMDRDPADPETTTTSIQNARQNMEADQAKRGMEVDGATEPSIATIDNPAGVKTLLGDGRHFKVALFLLNSLIDGRLESSKFEEEIRSMMGASAYFLSTMEKVVTAAIKQLVVIVSDEKLGECVRAIDEYESARSGALLAKVYKQTRSVLLQDNACFRMQFIPGKLKSRGANKDGEVVVNKKADAHSLPSEIRTPFTTSPKSSIWESVPRLLIELVDSVPTTVTTPAGWSLQSDVAVGVDKQVESKEGELLALRPSEVDFNSDAAEVHLPFLVRSKRDKAPSSTSVENGLRMSLVLPFFRISYVPGSEDVFQCIGKHEEQVRLAEGTDAGRELRFQKWYDAQLAQLGVTPEIQTEPAAEGKKNENVTEIVSKSPEAIVSKVNDAPSETAMEVETSEEKKTA